PRRARPRADREGRTAGAAPSALERHSDSCRRRRLLLDWHRHARGSDEGPHLLGGREVRNMTKFVFVTGGVVSSLGKGIAASAIGSLLKSRGLSVTLQKFDPYLNVDPGTMSPYQHGE